MKNDNNLITVSLTASGKVLAKVNLKAEHFMYNIKSMVVELSAEGREVIRNRKHALCRKGDTSYNDIVVEVPERDNTEIILSMAKLKATNFAKLSKERVKSLERDAKVVENSIKREERDQKNVRKFLDKLLARTSEFRKKPFTFELNYDRIEL